MDYSIQKKLILRVQVSSKSGTSSYYMEICYFSGEKRSHYITELKKECHDQCLEKDQNTWHRAQ